MTAGDSGFRGQLRRVVIDDFGRVEVVDHVDGERSLFFGSTVEQCRLDPETGRSAFEYVRWQALAPVFITESVPQALVLGLGGGALARTVFHRYPRLRLSAVELREAVVDLAYEAFDLPVHKRLEVYVADATVFLTQVDRRWDVVMSDLFDAQGIADESDDKAFYEACAARLAPGGVLAVNLWRVNMKRFWRSLKQLAGVFEDRLLCVDVDDANTVVYAFGATQGDLESQLQQLEVTQQAAVLELNLRKMIPYESYRKK